MSALICLRDVGLSVRLEGGEVVVEGLDRLPPEVAGPLLELARACREGIVTEIMAGPCPYPKDQLDAFAVSRPHLVCCPATSGHPWNWRERSWCESKCPSPCGRSEI